MASRQSINILAKKPVWRSARLYANPCRRNHTAASAAKRGAGGAGGGGRGPGAATWAPYLGISAGALAFGSLAYITTTTITPTKLDTHSLVQLDQATKQSGPITDSSPMRLRMEKMIKEKQKEIVAELGCVDGKPFLVDEWTRDDGTGGGISCVLQDGQVFEKAGCNVSVVYGKLTRPAIEKMRADHKSLLDASGVDGEGELNFFAAGLSMVIHPHNPMAPTTHLNYRYFETSDPRDPVNGKTRWWFGGGADLTPTYVFEEDCKHFHKTLKDVCDKHDPVYYPRFKKWCDEYFWLPHRKEGRGIGGIFFDDLDDGFLKSIGAPTNGGRDRLFAFATDCLASFIPSYVPIVEKRKNMPFTPNQKEWQQIRRGRYVEFNLIYDRGTQFGLRAPNARTESILMSLPRTAMWRYMDPVSGTRTEQQKLQEKKEKEQEKREGEDCHCDDKDMTEEEKLMDILRRPREWA